MLKQGMIIGERYEIVEKIGSGGMADVYKAKDHKLNRFVAIKVMKQEFREDPGFVSKFQVEAQSAAGLSHPNIVNVYDVGDEDGINYIVMELVEGITLKEYIEKKGKLGAKEATSIAIQVSMGVEAAHNNKIIHRDVKPQNIIISTDGKVKVTDFGIARAASSNTISSNVMGSVHYSSPEQARGGYSDAKSDIYSLGITMYEMVTGRVPFDGETTVAIAIKHLQEEMVPPTTYTPDLPYSVEQIIYKCTQKSADRRYANMEELIADLKQSLINPNGDFVLVAPLNNHAQTIMISKEELDQIKSQSGHGVLSSKPVEDDDDEYEDDDDDEYDDDDDDDEDDDGEISPKLEKAMMIGGVTVGIIILIILLALVSYAAGWFNFGSGNKNTEATESTEESTEATESTEAQVSVPNILGKSYDDAAALLEESGLVIKRSSDSPQPSDDYAAGEVMEQNIAANTMVDKNTEIIVVLSSGPKTISMVDVLNWTQAEAETALQNLDMGLNTKVTQEYNNTVKEGLVISTNPASGEELTKGQTVTIVVSKGQQDLTFELPSVVAYSESSAKTKLSDLGLYSSTETESSSTVSAGTVIRQTPAAGTRVSAGETIVLTISSGPAPVVKYRCNTQIQAPEGYDSATPYRIILRHSDGVETVIVEGAAVTFPRSVNVTSNVSSGTIYIYKQDSNGEFTVRVGSGLDVQFEQYTE